jgi:predicted aminopeptidase
MRDATWGGDRRYDRWIDAPINHARLVPVGLYDRWVAAFGQLFANSGSNWAAFYAQVRELAQLNKAERDRRLEALLDAPSKRAQ